MNPLERRVWALEAQLRVAELKAEYLALCDSGYDGEAIAQLFTEDASWASNTYPEARGRDQIADFMTRIGTSVFSWANHFTSNPRIAVDVDGGTATGRWSLLQLAAEDARSVVAVGDYRDRFRCDDGVWRFSAIRLDLTFVGDVRQGWAAGSSGLISR